MMRMPGLRKIIGRGLISRDSEKKEEDGMGKLLWAPTEERKKKANITSFMEFVNKRHKQHFRSYKELYNWSVDKIPDFWASVWAFVGVTVSKGYEMVVDDVTKMPGAKWFI